MRYLITLVLIFLALDSSARSPIERDGVVAYEVSTSSGEGIGPVSPTLARYELQNPCRDFATLKLWFRNPYVGYLFEPMNNASEDVFPEGVVSVKEGYDHFWFSWPAQDTPCSKKPALSFKVTAYHATGLHSRSKVIHIVGVEDRAAP